MSPKSTNSDLPNKIEEVSLSNFGPLTDIEWRNLSNLNLIVGDNQSGKTFFLKALYVAMKTIELHNRGKANDPIESFLQNKLLWTFEIESLIELINNGSKKNSCLSFSMKYDSANFSYKIAPRDKGKITLTTPFDVKRNENSVFLPAKEVLSLQDIIIDRHDNQREYGFDETYYDLAKALFLKETKGGRNFKHLSDARDKLKDIIGGKLDYDSNAKSWIFSQRGKNYDVGMVAEGVKKISILDILLNNRFLSPKSSIVFIDEIESALHPTAISKFIDIITGLAEAGTQFFITTHSYFVIKKLLLISISKKISIPVLSNKDGAWIDSNMKDGMPDNGIIDESINLYEQKLQLD